jgi:hypothetical protein
MIKNYKEFLIEGMFPTAVGQWEFQVKDMLGDFDHLINLVKVLSMNGDLEKAEVKPIQESLKKVLSEFNDVCDQVSTSKKIAA